MNYELSIVNCGVPIANCHQLLCFFELSFYAIICKEF